MIDTILSSLVYTEFNRIDFNPASTITTYVSEITTPITFNSDVFTIEVFGRNSVSEITLTISNINSYSGLSCIIHGNINFTVEWLVVFSSNINFYNYLITRIYCVIGYADIGIEIDISKIGNPLVIRILNVSHIY